jgi:hypothetical protein
LGLLLGSYKKDGSAVFDDLLDIVQGVFEHLDGLVKIKNVNAVSGAVDVSLHLGVPASCLVTKVHAGFQELFHAQLDHIIFQVYPLTLRFKFAESVNLGVACFTGAFHPDLVQPTRSCVMGELYPFAQLSEMNSQSILWVNLLELLSNQDWSDY